MKLLLSTSNILSGGTSFRKSTTTKSNAELVSSLQANFQEHSQVVDGQTVVNGASVRPGFRTWTRQDGEVLEIPALNFTETALQEEREAYDITAKLFFLPGTSTSDRAAHMQEAFDLVMKALSVTSIDLLILSFPGVYFDEQEDCPDKISTRGPIEAEPELLEEQLKTWRILEQLHKGGLVSRLGVAEFGKDRLEALLDEANIRPSVDQINLRDCCSVPKDLMAVAKSEEVELLVHNDCSNILPKGTIRELLGPAPHGVDILVESVAKTGEKRKSRHGDNFPVEHDNGRLAGEVQPQWVIKYTAVVKNRGVVESKGYFAAANVSG